MDNKIDATNDLNIDVNCVNDIRHVVFKNNNVRNYQVVDDCVSNHDIPVFQNTPEVIDAKGRNETDQPTSNSDANIGLSIKDHFYNIEESEFLHDVYHKAYLQNPSPIKPFVLLSWLDGYDQSLKDVLIDYVSNGVKLYSTFNSDMQKFIPSNQPSAIQNYEIVNKMLNEELSLGRIAGPFRHKSPGLIISPLAAVPKKDPGAYCIIHNLSYPLDNSVNTHTPHELCTVTYETIDDCIDIVSKLGRNCLISKKKVLEF